MTDSPQLHGRHPVQLRALSLGAAVPLSHRRPFDDTAEPVEPVVPKTADELRADSEERRDQQPMATSCGFCDWRFEGTAGECRAEAAGHREAEHPSAKTRPGGRRGRGIGTWRRDENQDAVTADRAEANRVRAEREDADRLAKIERGRARDALAAMDAGEPQPLALPTSSGDAGSSSSPTTHDEGTTMEASTNSRAKKWPHERVIAAIQEVAAEIGATPTIPQMVERGYTFAPSCTKLGLPKWSELVAEAGLTPNTRGGDTRSGREPQAAAERPALEEVTASTPPAVDGEESSRPEEPLHLAASDIPASDEDEKPEAALASIHLRDPIRTAAIPYDAELLDDEADFLVRRAAALRQMASAIRVLAEPRERAA